MQASSVQAGWDCEYRQMQPGQLTARTFLSDLGETSALIEGANLALEVACRAPDQLCTVGFPLSDQSLRINGRNCTSANVFLVPPKADLEISTSGESLALTLHLPERLIPQELIEDPQDFVSSVRIIPVTTEVSDARKYFVSWITGGMSVSVADALAREVELMSALASTTPITE